ncbi:MAG: hypothetical protein ACTSP3_14445, partial [Candidatus Heimdallarchaeaceae archaeon]
TPAEQVTTTVTLTEIVAGNYSYRLDFDKDAVYTFKVVSSDDKYIKDFLIDSNAPVITSGDWVNNTKPETRIDFTIKDSLTDIVKTTVKLNDEAVSFLQKGRVVTFVIQLSDLLEGDNILFIRAKDQVGNIVEATYIIPTKGKGAPFSTVALLFAIMSMGAVAAIFRRRKR